MGLAFLNTLFKVSLVKTSYCWSKLTLTSGILLGTILSRFLFHVFQYSNLHLYINMKKMAPLVESNTNIQIKSLVKLFECKLDIFNRLKILRTNETKILRNKKIRKYPKFLKNSWRKKLVSSLSSKLKALSRAFKTC